MTVYVDDMHLYPMGRFGRMRMSHLMADTTEELFAMVDKICVARKWIQHKGHPGEHFDIAMSKRQVAIAAGAIPITLKEMSAFQWARRTWGWGNGQAWKPSACLEAMRRGGDQLQEEQALRELQQFTTGGVPDLALIDREPAERPGMLEEGPRG